MVSGCCGVNRLYSEDIEKTLDPDKLNKSIKWKAVKYIK